MENYIITQDTPLLKVVAGGVAESPEHIWLSKGTTVTGQEKYLIMKEGKKIVGTKHVIAVQPNKYVPFELLKLEVKTSSVLGNKLESDVMQPNFDSSVSMMVGDRKHDHKKKHHNKKKMYVYYQMAVPPYYSISGKAWNKDILDKIQMGVDGATWLEQYQARVYNSATGSEKTVIEVTPDQLKKEYERSGSKQSFKDWIKSSGESTLLALGGLAAAILALRGGDKNAPKDAPVVSPESKKENDKEATILGMHPVTFGILAVVTLGAIAFFAFRGRGAKA